MDGGSGVAGDRPARQGVVMNPLVEFMLLNPGLADRLVAEHVDDGQGYCRKCTLGGQRGFYRFRCDIRRMADTARELEAAVRLAKPPDSAGRSRRDTADGRPTDR